ncbi:hypothetical protein DVK02_10720 [Halobellus sp. Atlit-31R]|nr:hypothetical protein DVK02_10720 [Halobellus sp. Atlit-31R]
MDGTRAVLKTLIAVSLVVSTGGAATAAAGTPAAAASDAEPTAGVGPVAGDAAVAVNGVDPTLEAGRTDSSPEALRGDAVRAVVDVDEPQTSDEFLAAFRELSERASLEDYSEFEVMRTQAIVAVQAGTFEQADRERMRAVLRTLVEFDGAYRAAEEGELSESLQAAQSTRETLSALESAGGTQYSSLAAVALDRFFGSLGERFEERSRGDGSTPERIAALRKAGEAYRLGGSSERFADVSVRAEQLATAYERDRERMNESLANAQRFFDRCGAACAGPVSAVATHRADVFGLYSTARTASAESSEAVRIARSHSLGERRAQLEAVAAESASVLLSLAIAAGVLLFAYAVLLAVPTVVIAGRISQWARDREAASVGKILTAMPAEVRVDDGE